MSEQQKITNRLLSLEDITDVSVEVSNGGGTIRIVHKKHHSLDFKFIWSNDHFIGYFIDAQGNQSQAVISLWSGLDTIYFATSYSLLVNLRAKQK